MSHPNPRRAGDDRVRRHIRALLEETKRQAADGPLHVQAFLSGMLSGLAASVEILDGGTAEGSLEKMGQRLAAAIGQAYLDGKLPEQPSDLVPGLEPEEESSLNTVGAELEQAQAAIARVRRLSEATIKHSVRAGARQQALDTLAALDSATSAADAMQAAGSPVMTGFTTGIGWKATDHVGHGSPCEETASGSCARPDMSALRGQLGAAITSAPSQELRQDGTGPLRITAYVPDLVSAVLAVIKPHARTYAGLARSADADVQRVIDLYERWVKAGPPPLGTSMARWWDTRLLELCAVINGAGPENPS
ncbi:hypothetical protein GCM10010372_30850 [Streptomyces tauricus]|uniref:hypothetical protein n=1 Tax=Streptomyces tauricus TaxID=68274 RepID=UPI00167BF669|nr:hypothetical protein [Streptomyces tauricus]GHA28826.1 hypothetical protein GCM10010372_30850 [Streptomyces tauricus]